MIRTNWFFLLIFVLGASSGEAAYALKEGKLIHEEELATMSVQEHYGEALKAFHDKNWEELIRQSVIISTSFPSTPFAHEAQFFLGKGCFELRDLDLASRHLTKYLKKQEISNHFEETIALKLAIAEAFRSGARKHVMGLKALPKWAPTSEDALKIYDEVVSAVPGHELAAKAFLGKALLLMHKREFSEAVENFQILIRRFPRSELAAEAFMHIQKCYLQQAQEEFPNPDLLDLAKLNINKFTAEFPAHEKVPLAEDSLKEMKEFFAHQMLEEGHFFERTKKPHAALIYYLRILRDFPMTDVAKSLESKIAELRKKEGGTLPQTASNEKQIVLDTSSSASIQ